MITFGCNSRLQVKGLAVKIKYCSPKHWVSYSCMKTKFCASCAKISRNIAGTFSTSHVVSKGAASVEKDTCAVSLGSKKKMCCECLSRWQMQIIGEDNHCAVQLPNVLFSTLQGGHLNLPRQYERPWNFRVAGTERPNAENLAPQALPSSANTTATDHWL